MRCRLAFGEAAAGFDGLIGFTVLMIGNLSLQEIRDGRPIDMVVQAEDTAGSQGNLAHAQGSALGGLEFVT